MAPPMLYGALCSPRIRRSGKFRPDFVKFLWPEGDGASARRLSGQRGPGRPGAGARSARSSASFFSACRWWRARGVVRRVISCGMCVRRLPLTSSFAEHQGVTTIEQAQRVPPPTLAALGVAGPHHSKLMQALESALVMKTFLSSTRLVPGEKRKPGFFLSRRFFLCGTVVAIAATVLIGFF